VAPTPHLKRITSNSSTSHDCSPVAAGWIHPSLRKQQLVVLVHSGSRGLGESILRAHVNQHFGEGVEADSFAVEDWLRGHDFAVRGVKANRGLLACRFVATLGAEAELLWDGCHNSIAPSPPAPPIGWEKVAVEPGEGTARIIRGMVARSLARWGIRRRIGGGEC
jgi:hypothetical protein